MVGNGIFRRSFDCFACNVNHDANQFMYWGSNARCTCSQYFCRWFPAMLLGGLILIVIFMANFGAEFSGFGLRRLM